MKELTRKPSPPHLTVHYRLLRISGQYWIRLSLGDEHITRPIYAENSEEARQIYDRIVKGAVTPCTLDDILEDLAY